MARCPKCGGTVAQIIKPESPTQLIPVATIACCGARSCGWSLGLWLELEAIEQMAELMDMELVAI